MIILTGAAGFIGSYVASYLARNGWGPLVLSDDFNRPVKRANFEAIPAADRIPREHLFDYIRRHPQSVDAIIHLGARTDTMEFDESVFERLNLGYSQKLWQLAVEYQIPLVYASSAATYGAGEHGFSDDAVLLPRLRPLNPYGWSKHRFDLWVMEQAAQGAAPPFWAGLKFFNVYGPNEYHKGRIASVVFHAFHQVKTEGKVRLFKSYRPEYAHGEQRRDFVYVRDVAEVIRFLLEHRPPSDIYNLGTGTARTFIDLVTPIFKALGLPVRIEFIDMPPAIRERYQYFTEADMGKLRSVGYDRPFAPVEEGVYEYVKDFLAAGRHY